MNIELTPLPAQSRKLLQVEGHWQSLNRCCSGLNVGLGGRDLLVFGGGSGALIGQTLPGSAEQTSALCYCATRVKLNCTSYTRRARIGCIDLLTPGAPPMACQD